MKEIIGRKEEVKTLKKALNSRKSEFIAVYGRRRVGKTFLIREFFNNTFDFQLSGLANANTRQQLSNFHTAFLKQSGQTAPEQLPENWFQAFQLLSGYLESIEEKRKKVIFLDELPWLDTPRSDFIMALEHFWNSWASARKDILLITCGSAASWVINKLIKAKGGLHNRVTVRMKINPFTLGETEKLLKARGNVLDRYQLIQLYMTMGGIPFYLDLISPDKSAWQNVEELCFRENGFLGTEFPILFQSLFSNARRHEEIITALSKKRKGMNRKEISKATGLTSGGGLTRLLRELEESGFITSYTPFDKKVKNTVFRLSDFFSMFYMRFMKNNRNYDEGVWVNALDNPAHRAWAGYTFEQVCLAHIPQIKKALGISGIVSHASSWQSLDEERGAQIDLLIDRRDRVINICELKYAGAPLKIEKGYAADLKNKLETFRSKTQTRKALMLTMITTYGLQQNIHARSLVNSQVIMDDLFD